MRFSVALLAGCLLMACDGRDRAPASHSTRETVSSAPPARSETTQASAPPSPVTSPQALDWTLADSLALRFAPDSFAALPPVVRADMRHRGCTVPQSPELKERHNVISGAFIQAGQTDWAVLCSVKRVSRILVYRAGRADVVDSLGRAEDLGYLQTIGGDTIGFSRLIGVADGKYIEEHAAAYDGPKPPPIDHLGINDIFIGKASGIHYLYNGKWIGLLGAD